MAKKRKFDVVAAVKAGSRERFRNMPKGNVIGDKRKKTPRYKEKFDE